MEKYNRRFFLKLSASGVGLFFVYMWNKLSLSHNELVKPKVLLFPFNKNKAVSFLKDFIVINKKGKATVLSAHCTHLGCSINKVENGKLVCPCHGSEFDQDGKAIKGPAYRSLEKIPARVNSEHTQIQIDV